MTNDPEADFLKWDGEREEARERLPVCESCGDHIQDETCYEVFGKIYCKSCMDDCIVFTDDLVEG